MKKKNLLIIFIVVLLRIFRVHKFFLVISAQSSTLSHPPRLIKRVISGGIFRMQIFALF